MKNDYSKAKPELLTEVIREGEAYLQAQVQLATSADQRASVMASVFAAAGTVIAAALIAATTGGGETTQLIPIFVGGGITAALFIVGASCCVAATLPVGFLLPGSQPKNWLRDITGEASLHDALSEQAANFQDKIDKNRKVLVRNASWFKWGARAGIVAPLVGFIAWLQTLLIIN